MSTYPPGGPIIGEQVTAQTEQPQVTPEMIAAVTAHLQSAQPAPVAPSVIPAPPPVRTAPPQPVQGQVLNGRPVDADEVVDHDFDAAWAERKRKAPKVRILGRVYTLPATAPAKMLLFLGRKGDDHKMDVDETVEMLGTLLGGKHVIEELFDRGLELDQLDDLMKYVMDTLKTSRDGQGEAAAETAITGSA